MPRIPSSRRTRRGRRLLGALLRDVCLGGLGLALVGCGALDFELELDLQESRIEGNPLGGLLGPFFALPIPLDVDLEAETAARDTGPASAVFLEDLRLTITETDEPGDDLDDFDFVESVTVYVESSDRRSTLPRARIAEVGRPARGARVLIFRPTPGVNLLPYVQEGARLTAEGTGEVPPDDVSFDGAVTLRVEI